MPESREKTHRFPKKTKVFQENRLPEAALPVGYAALIYAFDLRVPHPLTLCAIGPRHRIYEREGWRIYTPRHEPVATLEGHLVFALKYEGLDLVVLKRLFEGSGPAEIEAMVRARPTSGYARRIWFLYEWLLNQRLDVPDAKTGNYAEVVNPKLQWAVKGTTSTRHRVRNNLPGPREYCPLVRKTEALSAFVASELDERARSIAAEISADVLSRTAASLLFKDSKSSYAIEGQAPPHNRLLRWGQAIGEAGKHPLDEEEFLRLQRIVIGENNPFVTLGFRREGGFVGEHDRNSQIPRPDHISARHEDLPDLMRGLAIFDRDYIDRIDPVIAAAVFAFGFIYIHPFEDGNGRIHRYLIHHVLKALGFSPPGLVFPVSAVMLERIEGYRRVLETYSQRLLPLIEWRSTARMNVEVLNDTIDFYRYFDATPHAEFLFECVQSAIEHDLPEEATFLERYDRFKSRVEAVVEMPASTVNLLFEFLKQNNGKLSKRARAKEFAALTGPEVEHLETIYQDLFIDDAD